jgi:putative hydrolase of the HAD superfamily
MTEVRAPLSCMAIDFGGTLAARAEHLDGAAVCGALRHAYNWAVQPGFAEAMDRSMEAAYAGDRATGLQTPFETVIKDAALASASTLPDTVEAVATAVFDHVPDARVEPGAAEAIRALASRTRLVLASNTRWPLWARARTLEAAGIGGCFSALVLSSDLGVRKPHGEFYQRVLEVADAPARQVLFVGDTVDKDIDPPRAMGMQALLVAPVVDRGDRILTGLPLLAQLPALLAAVL